MSKENWIFDSVEKHKKKEKLPEGGLEVVTAIGNKLVDKKKNLAKEEERLKREKTQEEIELADRIGARVDEKNTVFQPTPGGPSQRGGAGKFRRLQAEKQLAKEIEVAKRVGDHMDRNQAPKVGKNMWPLQNDPYSFSTLSYPPEATNSKENGHFMLFYVNVQDKTKYQYDGVRNGGRVKVGDYIERPGYFESGDVTNVPPALRGANKFISSVEASGLGANAGTIDYQRQIVKNGGPGNILYNNMAFLSKGRKPKSGINSRYPTTTRITDSVALYLPSGIGNTTSASYGDFQTGVAGYLAMSGLDIVSELRNRDFQGAAEKLFGVGGTLITEAAKKLAVAGIETFTGSEGIQQSIELGKALAKQQSIFDHVIVGPHRRHMQTFEGIKKGYNSKNLPTPVINNDFAENQLMEIADYFIPQILNTNQTTKEIFNECEPAERHDKFLKLFQIVAQKWMNEELDLSKPGFEGFSVFRSRITRALKTMQDNLLDKSDIMIVTSGGAISGVYADVIECSHEEIQKLNFGIKNVSISEFSMSTERFTLKAFNSSLIPEELETFI